MAERGDLAMRMFRMWFPDLDDSGIDSDDTTRARGEIPDNQSDGSDNDEELLRMPWWPRGLHVKAREEEIMNEVQINNWRAWQASREHEKQALAKQFGQYEPVDLSNRPSGQGKRDSPDSPDRSSPPLFEVELTASDEDDDASVLELVIPMQARYQRVPTSSPKRPKPKPNRLFS